MAFTAGFADLGRIIENPTRKIPYAIRTPNAIAKSAAQTNITKLNKSSISFRPPVKVAGESPTCCFRPGIFNGPPQALMQGLSQNFVRVDPCFYWQIEYPQVRP